MIVVNDGVQRYLQDNIQNNTLDHKLLLGGDRVQCSNGEQVLQIQDSYWEISDKISGRGFQANAEHHIYHGFLDKNLSLNLLHPQHQIYVQRCTFKSEKDFWKTRFYHNDTSKLKLNCFKKKDSSVSV